MTTQRLPTIAALAASIFGASETVMARDGEDRSDHDRLITVDTTDVRDIASARHAVLPPAALDAGLDFKLDLGGAAEPGDRNTAAWRPSDDGSSLASAAVSLTDRAQLTFDFEPVYLGAFQDAQPPPAVAEHGHESLAEAATNPIASLIQLQFQNNSIIESNAGDGYSNVFTIQPVIPWKLGELQMVSRLTLPLLVATPDLGDPIDREYGLGDFVALNVMSFNIDDGPWKGMYGPIGAFTIPTASSDFTGAGKFQAGPGAIYLNLATKGVQWGIMGYQQWSFASAGGDSGRPEVSKLFIQPILNFHFEGGWYIGLQDILWSIDWNDGDRWSLPTGMRFGRVTKLGNQPVNFFVQPWYDISGNNKGNEWGIKFNVTLLFPTG